MQQKILPTLSEAPEPDLLVSRNEVANILRAAGFRTTSSTLAKLAVSGEGPEFIKFGRHVLYDPKTALRWAHGRLSVHRSTSDNGTKWAEHLAPDPEDINVMSGSSD